MTGLETQDLLPAAPSRTPGPHATDPHFPEIIPASEQTIAPYRLLFFSTRIHLFFMLLVSPSHR
jgi:hypothetical protein